MSEYLSKEEIKQWRSSLEKITLEEFAARLGKKIEEKKETNDIVDIVLHGQPVVSSMSEWNNKTERLSSIANRAFEKEKELYITPFSVKNLKSEVEKNTESKPKTSKSIKKEKKVVQMPKKCEKNEKAKNTLERAKKQIEDTNTGDKLKDNVRVTFKKALTDREQKVFDYFSSHQDQIVYAKDLAALLDLPRDYVYKYIKNLRAKIEGEALKNADKGGFVLSLK
jgi:DNA-binding CsgD family transcriptional regulator